MVWHGVALALPVFFGSLATRIPLRHWQSQWHADLSPSMFAPLSYFFTKNRYTAANAGQYWWN
jgi:hypothetical protein